MKITNSLPAAKSVPSSGATRSGAPARQSSAPGSTSSSVPPDQAARLNQLEAQYAPSDFSAAKVSEISAAIAAGQYQVNAGAVADKLLASTAALSGKSGAAN